LPYKKNGSIGIVSASGWGKSALEERIIGYVVLIDSDRPGIIVDTQGVDHRLLQYPGRKGPIFKNYGEYFSGINNLSLYCPIFASKKAYPEDRVYGVTLNDLNPYDLRSSSLQEGGVIEFFKIKQKSAKNRQVMDDPMRFYYEVEQLKASKIADTRSDLDYEGLVNHSIKDSMMRTFSWWAGYNPSIGEKKEYESLAQFNLRKRPPYFVDSKSKFHVPSFWHEWDGGKIVINNFMDCKEEIEGMALYGGYCLRDAYEYCNLRKYQSDKFPGFLVVVEEANLFITEDDTYLRKGSNYYFTELLCRGFKFEMLVIASFQSIYHSNSHIREYLTSGSNPMLIGKLNMMDKEYLSKIFPDIKYLELRDKTKIPGLDWGANEWAIYYNDREYDTFVPFPPLSLMHERG